MASQPGQPVQGNKGKFNWVKILIFILFVVGFGLLAWYLWGGGFKKKEIVRSQSYLAEKLRSAGKSTTDDNYINNLTVDLSKDKIYVDAYDNGVHSSFVVYGVYYFNQEFNNAQLKVANNSDYYLLHDATGTNKDGTEIKGETALQKPKGNPGEFYIAETKTSNSGIWINLLISLLPVLLLIGAFVWMAKKQGTLGEGLLGSNKTIARKIRSDKKFTDIAGQEEVKEEVKEVVDFLKYPNRYKIAGARIPKGILLVGPPGTGKTLVAKATAGEASVPFFFISASNFVEMFAGLGAKRVRSMFTEARKSAPAILFIDELDAIARKRGSSLSGNDEREQTLNQILVEMDGMEENVGLLIMAATNRPDVLDPAITRPGRFDRTITLNNPDVRERELILKLHAKGKRISKDVDFANIAKRVPGYSGAQLENIINEAAILSVRERTDVITIEQIDEAIDRVVAGPAKKSRVIPPEELKMIAYHEAGHAIIGLKVASSQQVQKITIIPRGQAGGYNLMTPKKETYNYKKSELLAMIMSFMGGRAAEQIIYGPGEVSTGAANDIQKATNIARAMVTQYGMSHLGPIAYEKAIGAQFLGPEGMQKDYSESMSERIDKAVSDLIISAENKAIKVIDKNRKLLELIATELLEKETIVKEEIEYINKHLKRLPAKKNHSKSGAKTKKSLSEIIKEVKDSTKVKKTSNSVNSDKKKKTKS